MDYELYHGDCIDRLREMDTESVNCCVTSPPYWGLRDYNVDGQLGLEDTPEAFVAKMVEVFREVRRVLRDDGTCWLNLGDSYSHGTCAGGGAVDIRTDGQKTTDGDKVRGRMKISTLGSGLPTKNLCGIPWRVALALQADGWYLRQDIIWHKPNPMPESVTDRCTKAHEYIFLLTKKAKYFYDHEAIKEPAICGAKGSEFHAGKTAVHQSGRASKKRGEFNGKTGDAAFRSIKDYRNKRSVWTVATAPYKEAHFATFPKKLIEPCILAGCPEGGTVLDPFAGSGTTLAVAVEHNRNAVGIELNPEYIELIHKRMGNVQRKLFS